jgi:hypothetical protein
MDRGITHLAEIEEGGDTAVDSPDLEEVEILE